MKVREILCKSAIVKCGFPGGGWAINPYVGCAHNCLLGTVTDPYQPLEEGYRITRSILEALVNIPNPISILTKSDLILRDIDLLKKISNIDVNFTINTLDEKWKSLVEPNSPSINRRLKAIEELKRENIKVYVMMGPYFPFFTDAKKLFEEFKKLGISEIHTESFNTIGGTWTDIEKVLKEYYPEILPKMKEIFFNYNKYYDFYSEVEREIQNLAQKHGFSVNIYFGIGHKKANLSST
ncbi:MAG: radical SAM protein [bacterium]|nr:radical SAM protein [bacterium]